MIPYGRQSVDDQDIAAVVEVLKGDWLTQGPHIEEFEEAVARRVGARHAVAYSSGTAALHGATHAARLGSGDLVVTTPLTFVASANCARYVGADVGFVDIDPETLNIDPAKVPAAADAVVAVHYAGLPVDLTRLAHRPRVVIEDAAQAFGAETLDGPVGNCSRSDLCVFSFHPVKSVTTAEGGVVTTNDDDLADRLRRFRTIGIRRMPEVAGWYYEVEELGFNYRMTDLHAALGTSQLRKLDRFIDRRNELADRYRQLLAGLPLALPPAPSAGSRHAYHLFVIRVADRRRVYDELRDAGVGAQVHYVPIHHHPAYLWARAEYSLPNADAAYEEILSIPLFPDLTVDQQDHVVGSLRRSLGG